MPRPGFRGPVFSLSFGRENAPLIRRRFSEDDDAFSYLIEFTTSMVVLIIILAAYYTAIEHEFPIPSNSDSSRVTAGMRIMDTLATTPGLAGNSTAWEELPIDLQARRLEEVGLAYPAGTNHHNISIPRDPKGNQSLPEEGTMLSAAKIDGLRNVTYLMMKDLFSLKTQEFFLSCRPIPAGNLSFQQQALLTLDYGVNLSGAFGKSSVERLFVVSFRNVNDPTVPVWDMYGVVSLKLILVEGIVVHPQVFISELNYAPTSGETEEEWLELLNSNSAAVDLSGWFITMDSSPKNLSSVRGSLILRGEARAVVCADPTAVQAAYTVDPRAAIYRITDGVFGIDGLSNGEGTIALDGVLVPADIVSYNSSLGGDEISERTLERISLHKNLFRESALDGGTPGY